MSIDLNMSHCYSILKVKVIEKILNLMIFSMDWFFGHLEGAVEQAEHNTEIS